MGAAREAKVPAIGPVVFIQRGDAKETKTPPSGGVLAQLVEPGGIEPPSDNDPPLDLHA